MMFVLCVYIGLNEYYFNLLDEYEDSISFSFSV